MLRARPPIEVRARVPRCRPPRRGALAALAGARRARALAERRAAAERHPLPFRPASATPRRTGAACAVLPGDTAAAQKPLMLTRTAASMRAKHSGGTAAGEAISSNSAKGASSA
eukprot:11228303-Lingulodinium_polyedra.AAC.1